MKFLLNKYFNDKSLSFFIINAIYVSVLKMNFLNLNILNHNYDFCVSFDIFLKLSQILKKKS